MASFYLKTGGQIVGYFLFLVLVPTAVLFDLHYLIAILLLLFAVYDLAFWKASDSFAGRTRDQTVQDIRAACGYVSFFIPVFVLVIGVFFAFDKTAIREIQPILQKGFALRYPLLGALMSSAVPMLFLPVQYVKKGDHGDDYAISPSLKNCFCIVMFFQKSAVVLMIYSVLRLFFALLKVGSQVT